jgi:hypothetical protein
MENSSDPKQDSITAHIKKGWMGGGGGGGAVEEERQLIYANIYFLLT